MLVRGRLRLPQLLLAPHQSHRRLPLGSLLLLEGASGRQAPMRGALSWSRLEEVPIWMAQLTKCIKLSLSGKPIGGLMGNHWQAWNPAEGPPGLPDSSPRLQYGLELFQAN